MTKFVEQSVGCAQVCGSDLQDRQLSWGGESLLSPVASDTRYKGLKPDASSVFYVGAEAPTHKTSTVFVSALRTRVAGMFGGMVRDQFAN